VGAAVWVGVSVGGSVAEAVDVGSAAAEPQAVTNKDTQQNTQKVIFFIYLPQTSA
jgi:hypothetical protein